MPVTCTKTDFADMVRAMKLPVPCKNRNDGCTNQHIIEKIEEHESECEHRWITGWVLDDGSLRMTNFKDFAADVDNVYIKEQKWHFKWHFTTDEEGECGGVFKFFIAPDQRRF